MIATDVLGEVERDQDTHTHTYTHKSRPLPYAYIYSYSYHLVYQHSGYRRPSEPEKYAVYVPTLPSDFTRRYLTSLQSKQTNKERKQERKQQQQQQIVVRLQLPVFSSRQETPWLAYDRVLVRRQPMLHYIYVFFAKNKSLSNTLPTSSLSLSALGPSNTYPSNLRAFQSSPVQ